MAPEQFQGLVIDHRVDIYAAGVVLYQLLCGHPPFTGAPEALMYRAVHEAHVPPSQLPGLSHLRSYDAVLARALAKRPAERYADAATFREALATVVGRRLNDAVSEATVTALLPPRGNAQPRDRGTGSSTASNHFDPAVLAQAEASLARLVGPLAQVLVRRAARDCSDLPSLYARLAEQVTDPAARQAFVSQVAVLSTGSRSMGSAAPVAPPTAGSHTKVPFQRTGTMTPQGAGVPVSAELQAEAQRLLAKRLGPIAQLVVRRAAAAAPLRQDFIARLAESLDDVAARQSLIDALNRLPS